MIVFLEGSLYGALTIQTVASSQRRRNPRSQKTLRQIQRVECARSLAPSSIRRPSFPTYGDAAGFTTSALARLAAHGCDFDQMELDNASVSLQYSQDGAF
jgi:hypothetical protein